MRASNDHDVLIVGAGPAGAQLALRLARAGWDVGLVEGKRFPRPKPCGEFLSPAGLAYPDEPGLLGEVRAAGAAREVGTVEALAQTMIAWLTDADLRHETGRKGAEVVERNRGARDAVLEMVASLLRDKADEQA